MQLPFNIEHNGYEKSSIVIDTDSFAMQIVNILYFTVLFICKNVLPCTVRDIVISSPRSGSYLYLKKNLGNNLLGISSRLKYHEFNTCKIIRIIISINI
jgi:hypothetical protein